MHFSFNSLLSSKKTTKIQLIEDLKQMKKVCHFFNFILKESNR